MAIISQSAVGVTTRGYGKKKQNNEGIIHTLANWNNFCGVPSNLNGFQLIIYEQFVPLPHSSKDCYCVFISLYKLKIHQINRVIKG